MKTREKKISILISVFALALGFLSSVCFSQEKISIGMPAYLSSGLPNYYPSTFVFSKDAKLLEVITGDDGEKELDKILTGVVPPASPADAKQADRLDKLLATQGSSLTKIVSKAHAYTLIGVEVDKSLGDCPPCKAYHAKVDEKLAAPNKALDAEFVTIVLMQK